MELEGPVLNGSGTFDAIAARRAFGDALLERFPFHAFVSKTITIEPRQGNPPPRLWETPAGMINSIGLPNKGLEGFLKHDLPQLAELPVPLVVSVMGFSRDELARLVAHVAERPEVAMVELNVSCPNVESGLVMGADPGETARAVERVRPLSDLPIVVKLTPNATEPAAVAAAAAGRRGRRGVADQHPQGHGAPSLRRQDRGSAAGPGECRARPSARSRWSRSTRSPSASRYPLSAWEASPRGVMRPISSPPAPPASPSAPRASATRAPAAGLPESSPRSPLLRSRVPDPPGVR